ncbi:MAG: flagellar motor switch protein FliN [Planctomycetes bacterium]|nr:flagellar motor switch protein FliN [Planctomycetota bacterium]
MDEAEGSTPPADSAPGQGGFSQEEIDALMSAASAPQGEPPAPAGASASPPSDERQMSPGEADLEALVRGAGADGAASVASDALPDSEVGEASGVPAGAPYTDTDPDAVATFPDVADAAAASATPFELADFGGSATPSVDPKRVTMLGDVNLRVKLELGRTRMLVEDVLKLGQGSVVELDKLAGDPVDILVNDRLVARGEVLVLNDSFCVRVSEVLSSNPHRVAS